jgi:hypothetical protein
MLTQRSWWLAALLAATAVVGAAPEPSEAADLRVYYPRGYEIAKGGGGIPASGQSFYVISYCAYPPPGAVTTGGGYDFDVPGAATAIESRPVSDAHGNGWRVDFLSNGGSGYAWVYAICADPSIFAGLRGPLSKHQGRGSVRKKSVR